METCAFEVNSIPPPPPRPPAKFNFTQLADFAQWIFTEINSMFMTRNDIIECINGLKIKNPEGYDGVPQRILDDGRDSLIEPLTVLFRLIYFGYTKRNACCKKEDILRNGNEKSFPLSLLICQFSSNRKKMRTKN